MIRATGSAAPLRFLLGVVLCWTLVRAATILGWRPSPAIATLAAPSPAARIRSAAPPPDISGPAAGPDASIVPRSTTAAAMGRHRSRLAVALLPGRLPALRPAGRPAREAETPAVAQVAAAPSDPGSAVVRPASSRLQGSGWVFLRGGDGTVAPLSPQGRIGGGQAGVRLLYAIDDARRISAAARLSRAIDGPRQTEAAIGVDVLPLPAVPVRLMVERRIAIDRGGRDAWAAGVAGGVYALPVLPATRLDGYAQAGIVGARRRDLYADGAVRLGREIAIAERASLTIGGGAWAAAQPRAKRVDVGPSAVLRVPVQGATIAAALDYRRRVTGDARPGSGPAFTLGVDF